MSAVISQVAPTIAYAEPLFESTHQALLFAYTFSANQHATCAVAERAIAMQGRNRYERELAVYRPSKGLSGLDGAAQAGMILAEVAHLRPLDQSLIAARFDVLDRRRRALAIGTVMLSMRRVAPVEPELGNLVFAVVRQRYGAPIVIDDLVDTFGIEISRRSVYRRAVAIRRVLIEHEDRAMMRIDGRLVDRQIVGSA